MSNAPKVRREVYQRASQSELNPYAANVVSRTKNVAAYQPMADAIADLEAANNAYYTELVAATNRSKDAVQRKNNARIRLIEALNRTAILLELNAGDNPDYITNAGMELQRAATRTTQLLMPPANIVATPTTREGEALLRFERPEGILTVAIEYSDDNGQNWRNGQYTSSSRNVSVTLTPHSINLVRLCSIGRRDRKSEWSEPVAVRVL